MKSAVIVDTGPLVAFLSERDRYHAWITDQMADIAYPIITCEAVISEACFLLNRYNANNKAFLLEMIEQGLINVPFRLQDEVGHIRRLMVKYADIPMSFADACLVRMAEQYGDCCILTLDSDFRIYRKHDRQHIKTIMPEDL